MTAEEMAKTKPDHSDQLVTLLDEVAEQSGGNKDDEWTMEVNTIKQE